MNSGRGNRIRNGEIEFVLKTTLDFLQVTFWSLTYILMIYYWFKLAYLVSWLALSIVIKYLFEMPVIDGKLYSVYILDIVMAGIFLVQADLVAREGQIVIACTKLLGDIFAWLAYCDASIFVGIIGFIVLILNIFYLSVCLERVQKKGAAQ